MAFSLRSTSSITGNGTSGVLVVPAGAATSDKVYALINHDSNTSVTLPTGWVIVSSELGTGGTLRILEFTGADPSAVTSWTFGFSPSSYFAMAALAISRDASNPTWPIGIDTFATTTTAASTGPAVCPDITPDSPDDLLISVVGWLHGTTFTSPGGWTEQQDVRSGNTSVDRSLWVATQKIIGGAGTLQTGLSVTNDNPYSQTAGAFKTASIAIKAQPAPTSWNGDFSTGDLSQYNVVIQGAPGRIQVLSDTPPAGYSNYARVTALDTDVYPLTPTVNPRAQLQSPRILYPNTERWLSFQVRFPTDFPSIIKDGIYVDPTWLSFFQLFGPVYFDSPVCALYVYGDQLAMRQRSYDGHTVVTNYLTWRASLERGVWLPFTVRIGLSQNDLTGFVELYYKGRRQMFVDRTYRRIYQTVNDDQNGGLEMDVMVYRGVGEFTSCTVEFAGVGFSDTAPSNVDLSPPLIVGGSGASRTARLT